MEIINTYRETLSHYIMKVSHAEEELEDDAECAYAGAKKEKYA